MIKEIIVVEGRDDITRVKEALDCEVIATGGYHFDVRLIKKLRILQEKRGVIVLTDPDYAGERIRSRIARGVHGVKHAWLPRGEALATDGDVGIENASPESIRQAISNAKPEDVEPREEFTLKDLFEHGLTYGINAQQRREALGDALGIGYCNAKQLLRRLNHYGITREEFDLGMEAVNGNR